MSSPKSNKDKNKPGVKPTDRKKTKSARSNASKGPHLSGLARFVRRLGNSSEERAGGADIVRTVVGLLLLGFSLFVFASLIFYLVDAKSVYSQLHSEDIIEAELNNASVGSGGVSIGYWFFNGLLGWGSFAVALILSYAGIALLWMNRDQVYTVLGRCLQIVLGSVWLSMFLSTLQNLLHAGDSVLKWGGDLGEYYTSTLIQLLGAVGLAIFYAVSLLILLVIFSDRVLFAVNNPKEIKAKVGSSSSVGRIASLFRRKKVAPVELDDDSTPRAEEEETETMISDPRPSVESQPNPMAQEAFEESDRKEDHLPIDQAEQSHTESSPQTESSELVVTVPEDKLVDEVNEEDPYVPGMYLKYYHKPTIDLLNDYGSGAREIDRNEIEQTKQLILDTLGHFRIPVTPASATVGPTVTLYEIVPEQGVKISRIKGVENDLMLALKSQGIRIIAPMPGKGTVGIEVPNRKPLTVSMRSIIASQQYKVAQEKMELPIGIGKTITNEPFIFDLAKMPHILIAGATGQGKSVGLNALITSLLYSKRPEELKLIMVDPKMLEFSIYEELENHFMAMAPDADKAIITDMDKVVPTLNSLCVEMDNRYVKLSQAKVRNIKDYNEKVRSGELSRLDGFDFLPYIVLIVDEWADLVMTAGREAELPIARLAQKARAAGIHIVLATQRPSTDVVTGLIKANFPARIAFKVSSGIDSSTILGNPSAHNLIGRGDMLFFQGNDLVRIQCAFMDTPETEAIVSHIARQESEGHAYVLPEYVPEGDGRGSQDFGSMKKDVLFEEAARLIVSNQMGSASLIQRKMEIGFARAGRLMDQLEAAGIVGPQRGSKPREVLVSDTMHLESLLEQLK